MLVPAPLPPKLHSLDAAALDAFISKTLQAYGGVGLTVAVMQDGKVIYSKGFGHADLATEEKVTPETLFAIGSITKQFTCALGLLLEEEGKLSFDDKVSAYEPSLTRAQDITLRDLAQHVAGYRDYYPLDFIDERKVRTVRASHELGNKCN